MIKRRENAILRANNGFNDESHNWGEITMGYDTIPYEKRMKENIRNYTLSNLYDMEIVKRYLSNLAEVLKLNVVGEPGRKLRIQNRTIGHLYVKHLAGNTDNRLADELLDGTAAILSRLGEEAYLRRESSIYLEELEKQLEDKKHIVTHNEREDILTGVFNRIYFENRMKLIDRSEVIPVAVLNVNINDWKFVNDHFGDEESDRLIRVIADILQKEAKPDFVIGRVDGDVFGVLIPMAQEGEAEDYRRRIQEKCLAFEDSVLAPSVAVGMVYKTNIEETLEERLSDAEYEMFNNKFEIKNAPGYRERLERGLK